MEKLGIAHTIVLQKIVSQKHIAAQIDYMDRKENQLQQDWDAYWAEKNTPGNIVYDFLSGIYRRLIVKNILNFFIKKHFSIKLSICQIDFFNTYLSF